MVIIFKKRMLGLILSSVIVMSCSTNIGNINNLNSGINNKKTFGIKSSTNIVQNTDLTYYGDWLESGNIHQSTGTINNTHSSLSYSGNWTILNNGLSSEGNYSYTNNGDAVQIANDTSSNVTYTRNGWLTYSEFRYNDINSSSIYRVTNQEIDINKVKYIYSGVLDIGPKEESWSSSSMHPAWRTQASSEGISYTESRESTSKIEIPFSGTNIQVYQFKTPLMGQCLIKVFDSNNNQVRYLLVNNNGSWTLGKTLIRGLPNGNYKLVIEGLNGNRFNFVRADVLPSIEYKFTGNNINYNAFTGTNCGRVAITIDNIPATTVVVDLYDWRNIYQNIYTRTNLGSGEHTITIDALGEKNPSSTGFRINLNEFNSIPSVRGVFTGTFLNLKLVGNQNSGKADLYIDGALNQEVDLYYSSSSGSYYSINVGGLINTNHIFELRAKNTKNPSSTGTRINFDGYTTNKASYTFTGTAVKYFANKNNNQGMVDVFIDGTLHGRYDLYSETLQESQEIVNITGLSNGSHTIDLIPVGVKKWYSTGYGINVDYLEIENNVILNRIAYRGYDGTTMRIYVSNWNGTSWTTPVNISTNSTNNGSPKISSDGNTVTWLNYSGTGYKIYVSNWNGTSWTTPVNLTPTDYVWNNVPEINSEGNRIAWVSDNEDVYESTYNGTSWSSPNFIYDYYNTPEYPQGNETIKMTSNGNRATWLNKDEYKIYVANYNGTSWSSPALLTNTSYGDPKISSNGNRITWSGWGSGQNNIYVSSYNGTSWSSPIIISSTDSYNPKISSDGNRITWNGWDVNTHRIYESTYNGTSWSSPNIISTNSNNNYNPEISTDGNKIIWKGYDGTTDRIYLSIYNGTSWSSPNIISNTSTQNTSHKISSDGNIITWYGKDSNNLNRIHASNYNGTSWSAPVGISSSVYYAYDPAVN